MKASSGGCGVDGCRYGMHFGPTTFSGRSLLTFIGTCIATASSPLFAEEHAAIPTLLFGMIAPIPYQVFAGVGVFRSASGRGVLGMLAGLIVVVQLIAMLFVFGGLSKLAVQGQLFAD